MRDQLSLYRYVAQIGTRIKTLLTGVFVGTDDWGNRYYRSRKVDAEGRETRWVLYAGEPDPTMIPPDWFGWLHYSYDRPLPCGGSQGYFWLKPHSPNLTGSVLAYRPKGAILSRLSERLKQKAATDPRVWCPAETEKD